MPCFELKKFTIQRIITIFVKSQKKPPILFLSGRTCWRLNPNLRIIIVIYSAATGTEYCFFILVNSLAYSVIFTSLSIRNRFICSSVSLVLRVSVFCATDISSFGCTCKGFCFLSDSIRLFNFIVLFMLELQLAVVFLGLGFVLIRLDLLVRWPLLLLALLRPLLHHPLLAHQA